MVRNRQAAKLARFRALSAADKQLLVRATAWLLIARIAIAVLPFGYLARRFSAEASSIPPDPDEKLLLRVGRAVSISANHVPWRADCFPRTIAARMLLKRYGYASTIHIGVERQGEHGLEGHAWLTCGDTVVTGGAELDRYTELGQLSR